MSLQQFDYDFTKNPIFLKGGVATGLPGDMMPLMNLIQANAFPEGPTGSANALANARPFAEFVVATGSSLVRNQFGMYPFANQSVAANANIVQPKQVSMLMICPGAPEGGYSNKLALMQNLVQGLEKHCNQGGTFVVATPAFIYTACLLENMADVTGGETQQVQALYRLDFVIPLLTLEAARAAQNSLMQKTSDGVRLEGDPPKWSSIGTASGASGAAAAGAASAIMAAAKNPVGSSIGGRTQ